MKPETEDRCGTCDWMYMEGYKMYCGWRPKESEPYWLESNKKEVDPDFKKYCEAYKESE